MERRQQGRHIVVTGASSGIGRAIAERLAAEGALVNLLARREPELRQVAAGILHQGRQAAAVPCDLTDPASVEAAFKRAVDRFGPIHGLVAVAGIGGPNQPGPEDRFEALIQTNTVGTYRCLRAAESRLAPGPGRRDMVVISSILARFGVPGYTGYCASKAALLGMVKAFALELAGQGVQVNAVCPGWVETDMAWQGIDGMAQAMGVSRDQALAVAMRAVPLGRMGKPEEVAGLVAWLLSPDAAGVTGQALDQNGGAWMG